MLRHPWASESGSPRDCCPNVHPQHSLQRCDSQPLRGTSPRPGSAVGTESRCGINSVNSDKLENLEMLTTSTTSTTLMSQQVGWSCAKSVDVPRTHHVQNTNLFNPATDRGGNKKDPMANQHCYGKSKEFENGAMVIMLKPCFHSYGINCKNQLGIPMILWKNDPCENDSTIEQLCFFPLPRFPNPSPNCGSTRLNRLLLHVWQTNHLRAGQNPSHPNASWLAKNNQSMCGFLGSWPPMLSNISRDCQKTKEEPTSSWATAIKYQNSQMEKEVPHS